MKPRLRIAFEYWTCEGAGIFTIEATPAEAYAAWAAKLIRYREQTS